MRPAIVSADVLDAPGLALEVVHTIREPLLILDTELRVRLANPAFLETFRVEAAETVGRPVHTLGNGQWDIPALRTLLEEVLAGDAVVEGYEVEHVFPDLGRRVMRLNARRVDREGGADMVLLAFEDVTGLRDAQSELARTLADLRRSNQELEQFAYAASHDLQEPLRMVTQFLSLLEERYRDGLDERARHYIVHAVEGATRMKALIADLLRYSRAGVRELEVTDTALEEALGQVLDDLALALEAAGAVVTHDPLPVVRADAVQVGQLLRNLVENAVKFRKPGEAARVHLSARREEEGWLLEVRDEGIGIAPRHQERIFRIFQRLHTREEYPGTGIGLALCWRIVHRHGGTIEVDSDEGRGATFVVRLPDDGGRP